MSNLVKGLVKGDWIEIELCNGRGFSGFYLNSKIAVDLWEQKSAPVIQICDENNRYLTIQQDLIRSVTNVRA